MKPTATGYVVFLAFPLGLRPEYGKPVLGKTYTFDIQINDATTPANTRTGQATWNDPSAQGGQSGDGWGELVLYPAALPSVSFSYDGEYAKEIVPGKTLSVSLENVSNGRPHDMYVALYDDRGVLVKVVSASGVIADGRIRFDASLALPDVVPDGSCVKVFAWDAVTFAPSITAILFE